MAQNSKETNLQQTSTATAAHFNLAGTSSGDSAPADSTGTMAIVTRSRTATPEYSVHLVASPPGAAFKRVHDTGALHSLGAGASRQGAQGLPRLYAAHQVGAFIVTACSSSLLASALASIRVKNQMQSILEDSIELNSQKDSGRWVLSAMLALYLRSGLDYVSDEVLLALLWILEAWQDARSSASTHVLGEYIRYLAAFSRSKAEQMSANWREEFTALRARVVAAQLELLQGMRWQVRLSPDDVLSANCLLFGGASDMDVCEVVEKWLEIKSAARHNETIHAPEMEYISDASSAEDDSASVLQWAWAVQATLLCWRVEVQSARIQLLLSLIQNKKNGEDDGVIYRESINNYEYEHMKRRRTL